MIYVDVHITLLHFFCASCVVLQAFCLPPPPMCVCRYMGMSCLFLGTMFSYFSSMSLICLCCIAPLPYDCLSSADIYFYEPNIFLLRNICAIYFGMLVWFIPIHIYSYFFVHAVYFFEIDVQLS